jgi:hypothetical protein
MAHMLNQITDCWLDIGCPSKFFLLYEKSQKRLAGFLPPAV